MSSDCHEHSDEEHPGAGAPAAPPSKQLTFPGCPTGQWVE
jgi:hypothetical protein